MPVTALSAGLDAGVALEMPAQMGVEPAAAGVARPAGRGDRPAGCRLAGTRGVATSAIVFI